MIQRQIRGRNASYMNLRCDSAVSVGQLPTDIFRSPKQGVASGRLHWCKALPSQRSHTRQGDRRGLLQTDRGTNMKSVATRPGEAVILTDWCRLGSVASISKHISSFDAHDHSRILCSFKHNE
jgi:hypothetical protein